MSESYSFTLTDVDPDLLSLVYGIDGTNSQRITQALQETNMTSDIPNTPPGVYDTPPAPRYASRADFTLPTFEQASRVSFHSADAPSESQSADPVAEPNRNAAVADLLRSIANVLDAR